MAMDREISCPSVKRCVSTYKDVGRSTSICNGHTRGFKAVMVGGSNERTRTLVIPGPLSDDATRESNTFRETTFLD